MNEDERNELLIQIKEKLDNLIKTFDKVSNGTGFPRCVEREQRIKRLEQDVIAINAIITGIDVLKKRTETLETTESDAKARREKFDLWLMRSTWLVIIAALVKLAFF